MSAHPEPPFGGPVPTGTEFLPVDHAKDPNGFRDLVVRGRTVHIRLGAGAVVGQVRSAGGGALDRIELEGGIEVRLRNVSAMWVERRPCTHGRLTKHKTLPGYICTDDDRPDCHAMFNVAEVAS